MECMAYGNVRIYTAYSKRGLTVQQDLATVLRPDMVEVGIMEFNGLR